MDKSDKIELEDTLTWLRKKVTAEQLRVTQHAQQEMVNEEITLDEVIESILAGEILEYYPEHRRGPCCLVNGTTRNGRPLHVVCATGSQTLIFVTVYEPKPPKWLNPIQRRK